MPKNWSGVLLHVLTAVAGTAIVTGLGFPVIAFVVNTFGWPVREALQSRTPPWLWSAQKHWEAWPPVLIGWLVIAEVLARG